MRLPPSGRRCSRWDDLKKFRFRKVGIFHGRSLLSGTQSIGKQTLHLIGNIDIFNGQAACFSAFLQAGTGRDPCKPIQTTVAKDFILKSALTLIPAPFLYSSEPLLLTHPQIAEAVPLSRSRLFENRG
jgi:hypothetical protein